MLVMSFTTNKSLRVVYYFSNVIILKFILKSQIPFCCCYISVSVPAT